MSTKRLSFHIMNKILGIISEITLFGVLLLFPFSYEIISVKWAALLTLIIIWMILLQIKKKTPLNVVAIFVLFLIIFDFEERVNFVTQFNMSVNLSQYIPVSTIVLAAGVFFFLLKILVKSKLTVNNHPFARYFLFSCVFIVFFMILFYPFLSYHYQMNTSSNVQLLNKIFKYLLMFLLVSDCMCDETKQKRVSLGLIVSIGLTVALSFVI